MRVESRSQTARATNQNLAVVLEAELLSSGRSDYREMLRIALIQSTLLLVLLRRRRRLVVVVVLGLGLLCNPRDCCCLLSALAALRGERERRGENRTDTFREHMWS